MKIKNEKIQFTVTVEIGCSAPDEFESQQQFKSEDVDGMRSYLSEKIKTALTDSWQYAAKVERITMKPAKIL